MHILPMTFFSRPTNDVARELIGKLLVHERRDGERLVGRIVETEAYTQDEPACHAWNVVDPQTGRVKEGRRGASLYGPPGRAYVYLNYGMYWLLNVVTEPEGRGAAVLIRAVEPVEGIEYMLARRPGARSERDLTNGPGKLVLAFGIEAHAHEAVLTAPPLYFAENGHPPGEVGASARIGITRGRSLPWRYFEKGNSFVSPGRPSDQIRIG